MTSGQNHNTVGLSSEELQKIVRGEISDEQRRALESKMENCDLSKPAVELIKASDLASVNKIAASITSNYPIAGGSWTTKLVLWGLISVGFVAGLGYLLSNKEELNPKNSQTIIALPESEDTLVHNIVVEQNAIKNRKLSSTAPKDTKKIAGPSHEEGDEDVLNKDNEASLKQPIFDTLEDPESMKRIPEDQKLDAPKVYSGLREIKAITITTNIPEKYKDKSYSTGSLVTYNTGDEGLKKALYEALKNAVDVSSIPKSSRSVVFKFSVTYKGKVSDVDVQSIVAPELENKIKDVVLKLEDWSKGDKRIPVEYTVFVTFK